VTTEVWAALAFYAAAILGIIGGLLMVTQANMVRSALSLVLALASVALIFLLLSADFLAMVQLLVYVGAIMILMIFAIMLTPGQVELPALAERGQHLSAALVAVLIGGLAIYSVLVQPWSQRGVPLDQPTTVQIGRLLMGPNNYALPFEIASLLLTAAMIGAIVIARED
jgi:NADH:ubiquinone oxidoreductase subunit 6 (subunit J)